MMPHVIVKLQSGRNFEQKTKIAALITKAVMEGAACGEDAVSVAIEDVEKSDWVETVYKPDILARDGNIFKRPGYDPL